jgi:hypothetical protein
MKSFSKKLAKKPLALSPLSLAIAACGGGGGDSSSSNQSSNSNSSTSTSYGSYLYSITSREMESNNTPKTANFAKQTVFTGQTYSNDDDDYYYVNVPDWDVIVLNFSSSDTSPHVVSIIDSLGFTLSSNDLYTNATIVAKPYHAGEVYVLVEGTRFDTKDYTISLSQGSGNYEMEPNNFPSDADQIYNNTPIKGQSHSSDDDDYFTFTATSSTTIISFSTSDTSAHSISILNSAEQTMSMADIYTSGTLTASTFIGQKYYVLVDGTRFDKSEYTLTLNPSNSAPTGNLSINGEQSEGQTLTVDTSSLTDLDGLGSFAYQWFRDGVEIRSENSQNYQLNGLDIGSKISVRVSYTDGAGMNEIINSQETVAISPAKTAQYYNNLFFDDFSDVRWENNIGQEAYTFGFATPENKHLWTDFELQNVREFTNSEQSIVINAMSDWGEALPEVNFIQSDDGNRPDLFFCFGSLDFANSDGQWNYAYNSDHIVTRALIRFDVSDTSYDLREVTLHEIGNILGLGDIRPSSSFVSIMEDPIPNYPSNVLTDFDISMINTIYEYDGNLEIIT